MIRARGLSRIYRLGEQELRALDGVDVDIAPGEFVALVGPSGSGKSTLMHTLGLLDKPDAGSYQLLGRETKDLSEDERAVLRSRTLGFVFQQFNLLPRTSAEENVALPRLYHPEALREGEARALLEQVGLGDRLRNTPAQLSGGQQQRVAIARALLNKPRLLFADEPTGNLDSKSSLEIMRLFAGLHAKGLGIVLVTHELDIAAFANRVITLKDGKIVSDKGRKSAPKARVKPPSEPFDGKRGRFHAVETYFRQALRALLANRLRSALSMLGILIGVAAVVAMLGIGSGAQRSMEKQLSSMGSNLLMIMPGGGRQGGVSLGSGSTARFVPEDAAWLLKQVPGLKRAGAEVGGRVQAVADGKNWSTSVTGAVPDYAQMRAAEPVLGRFFTEQENHARARVAVVGVTVVQNLWGDVDPVGRSLKLNKVSFRVIGVLPAKGSSGWRNEDDRVIIPVNTAMQRLLGKDKADMLSVELASADGQAEITEQIKAALRQRLRVAVEADDPFQVFNMAEMQAALKGMTQTFTLLLASIAAISLLVGGIGIMNILLVSVTERTREIGLRKALGARPRDIKMQFLVEAAAISLLGGLTGLLFGAALALGVGKLAGWAIVITPFSVALALGFSAGVGILFGYWPASQAAKLDPISALRYE